MTFVVSFLNIRLLFKHSQYIMAKGVCDCMYLAMYNSGAQARIQHTVIFQVTRNIQGESQTHGALLINWL